jgi:hypothetical protein
VDLQRQILIPGIERLSCCNTAWVVFARKNTIMVIDLKDLSVRFIVAETEKIINSIAINDRDHIVVSWNENYSCWGDEPDISETEICDNEITVFDARTLAKLRTINFQTTGNSDSNVGVKCHGTGFFAWNNEKFRLYKVSH